MVICASLVRSIFLSRQAHSALREQQQYVERLQEEVDSLEEQVRTATSSFELERRIREDLDQQKSGEQIIRLQPN